MTHKKELINVDVEMFGMMMHACEQKKINTHSEDCSTSCKTSNELAIHARRIFVLKYTTWKYRKDNNTWTTWSKFLCNHKIFWAQTQLKYSKSFLIKNLNRLFFLSLHRFCASWLDYKRWINLCTQNVHQWFLVG